MIMIINKVYDQDLVNLLGCTDLPTFINKSTEEIEEYIDTHELRRSNLIPVVYTYSGKMLASVDATAVGKVLGLDYKIKEEDTLSTVTNLKAVAYMDPDVVPMNSLVRMI